VSERTEELLGANDNLRELSARLLRLRDEEHRRIARELHDSVGQLLAAINMNTGVVKRELDSLSPNAQALLHENSQMIDEVIRQIRTLSYLLHPPQLDESGLPSALQWFVDGFAKRSEIEVKLEIAEDFPRLTEEAETSIFRTVQECLTNIHRHSGSPTAEICLQRRDGKLEIEVRDKGKGISGHRQKAIGAPGPIGVGVRGMRERWRQLGGSLEILSTANGTIVKASIPEPKADAAAANVGTP
jgi:signal transduction histidine kinase